MGLWLRLFVIGCLSGCVLADFEQRIRESPSTDAASDRPAGDSCFHAPDTGECSGFFPRWFYNPAVDKCQLFAYRGCGGNGNNFPDEPSCMAACANPTVDSREEMILPAEVRIQADGQDIASESDEDSSESENVNQEPELAEDGPPASSPEVSGNNADQSETQGGWNVAEIPGGFEAVKEEGDDNGWEEGDDNGWQQETRVSEQGGPNERVSVWSQQSSFETHLNKPTIAPPTESRPSSGHQVNTAQGEDSNTKHHRPAVAQDDDDDEEDGSGEMEVSVQATETQDASTTFTEAIDTAEQLLRPQPPRRPLFSKFRPIFKMIFRHRFRQERPPFATFKPNRRQFDHSATTPNLADRRVTQTMEPSTLGMSRMLVPRTEVTTRAFSGPQQTVNIRRVSTTSGVIPSTTAPPMVEKTPEFKLTENERLAIQRNFLNTEPKINVPPVHMFIKKLVPRLFRNSGSMFTSPFDQYQQMQPMSTRLDRERPILPERSRFEPERQRRPRFGPRKRLYEDNSVYNNAYNNELEREEYPRYKRPASRFNVFQLVFNRPKYDQHVHSWHSASPPHRDMDHYHPRPESTLYSATQPWNVQPGEPNFACLKPVHSGYCHFFSRKWYFNQYRGRCEVFWYSGCGGSSNRFETDEECSATCMTTSPKPVPTEIVRIAAPTTHLAPSGYDAKTRAPTTISVPVVPETTKDPEVTKKEGATSDEPIISNDHEEFEVETEDENKQTVQVEETDVDTPPPVDIKQTPLGMGLSARLNDVTVVLFICALGLATIVLLGVLVACVVRRIRKTGDTKKQEIVDAVLKAHMYADFNKIIFPQEVAVSQTV